MSKPLHLRRRTLHAAAGLIACAPLLASAGDWHPFVQSRVFAASDAMPVSDYDGDWAEGFAPREGRNVLLRRVRAEAGVEKDGWRLSWESRAETLIVTDRPTLAAFRLYKLRQKPAGEARYALSARGEDWSAQGPRLGRWFGPADAAAPRLLVSGALYTHASLRQQSVSGSLHYLLADLADFQGQRIDANNRMRYPFMGAGPDAAGASMALALEWRPSSRLSLNAGIDDVLSTMRWRNLPVKEERIDSLVRETDPQGYLNFRPLLNGSNRQVDRRFTLARSGGASLRYDAGAVLLDAGIERVPGVTIPSLGLGRRFGWGLLTGKLDMRFRTLSVGIETQHVTVGLQTDRLPLGRAKALGLSLSARY